MDPVPLPELLGRNVRVLRKALGMSQEDLADAMRGIGFGWVRQTVEESESGRRDATIEELLGLVDVFEVPLSQLIGQLGSTSPADEWISVGSRRLKAAEISAIVQRSHNDVIPQSFLERRQKALEARKTAPGPIFLWEGEGDLQIGTSLPPWSQEFRVVLHPGVPYTARDEYEAEQLQAVIDERRRIKGVLRVINRHEAYRIRDRLRKESDGTHQEG